MRPLSTQCNRQEFLSDYFEKQPLLLKGAALGSSFSIHDLESILHSINAKPPRVNVFLNGPLHWSYYAQSRGDPDTASECRFESGKLRDLLNQGATVSLNKIHQLSPAIAAHCGEVSALLDQSPVVANGYLCMGGEGSFGAHWDTHDVFAVQLIGRKRWQVFEPTYPLPLNFQSSHMQKDRCPATPLMDFILEKGDIFYLPRGWWHEAQPLTDTSFHISIGVHSQKAIDFASWVCEVKLPAHICARKTFQNNGKLREVGEILSDLIADPTVQGEYLLSIQKQRRSSSPFDLSYLSNQSEKQFQDPPLYLNSTYFKIDDDTAIVNGNIVGIDKDADDVLKIVRDNPGIRAVKICGMLGIGGRDLDFYISSLIGADILNTGIPDVTKKK